MAFVGAFLFGVLIWGYLKISTKIVAHASDKPAEIPAETGTRADYETLLKRVDDFRDASTKTLTLTAGDINLLLAYSPDWKLPQGRLHAGIENDQIIMTGVLPAGDQYLNGEARFTVSKENNVLHTAFVSVKLKDADINPVNARKIATICAAFLANENMPVLGPVVARAKTLGVKDGVITFTAD
ncbi:MAG TPA: hypothetical protein VG733_11565 [Chthoniobacteraceae bacterium]|nr:hypothetical protein [Chthoniobacteraceae bacterium]